VASDYLSLAKVVLGRDRGRPSTHLSPCQGYEENEVNEESHSPEVTLSHLYPVKGEAPAPPVPVQQYEKDEINEESLQTPSWDQAEADFLLGEVLSARRGFGPSEWPDEANVCRELSRLYGPVDAALRGRDRAALKVAVCAALAQIVRVQAGSVFGPADGPQGRPDLYGGGADPFPDP
jgi:hypothetical protein